MGTATQDHLAGIRKCLERPVLAVTSGGPLPGQEDLSDVIEKAAAGEGGEAIITIAKAVNVLAESAEKFKREVEEQIQTQRGKLLRLCEILEG